MPRRASTVAKADGPMTMQLNARVRPEQDMVLTVLARVKGTDKSTIVSAAVDSYIAALPSDFVAALVAMEKAAKTLDGQPEFVPAES